MLPYSRIYPYLIWAIMQIVFLFAVTPLRKSLLRSIFMVAFVFVPMIFAIYISLRWYFGTEHKNLLYPMAVEIPLLFVFVILSKRKVISQIAVGLAVLTISSVLPIAENLFHQILYRDIAWIRGIVYPIIIPSLYLFFKILYGPLHNEIERVYKKGFIYVSPVLLLAYTTLWVTFSFAEENLVSMVMFLLPAILVLVLLIFMCVGIGFFLQKYRKSLLKLHDATVTESQFEPLAWQIQLLQKGQEQLAIARHDMRHALTSINALLSEGDTDKAQKYITSMLGQAGSFNKSAEFSKNILVNSLISNYTSIMAKENIKHDVNIYSLPETLDMDEMELSVFLCNAIENAIKATKPLPEEERYILIKSSYDDDNLLLTIENTYDNLKPIVVEELDPLSISGIGLYSMQNFANKYGVLLDMKTSGNIFSLRAYFTKNEETQQVKKPQQSLEKTQLLFEKIKSKVGSIVNPKVENTKNKTNDLATENNETIINNTDAKNDETSHEITNNADTKANKSTTPNNKKSVANNTDTNKDNVLNQSAKDNTDTQNDEINQTMTHNADTKANKTTIPSSTEMNKNQS